jgi:hypothetical protein
MLTADREVGMGADVVVYYNTGKQLGPLSVPRSWCEECDLTVRAVQLALAEVDAAERLSFETKPWLRHAIPALLRRGWHPLRDKVFGRAGPKSAEDYRNAFKGSA